MFRHSERIIAYALTGVALVLHLFYVPHAGGLWRDEANTVALATMPTLSDVWAHLQYDSFPILWLLVVRALSALGLTADIGFRILGCCVGLSILAGIWINARRLKFSTPIISLALLGFSPTILQWGDSIRAYGFGLSLILLTMGLVWKVVTSPGAGSVTVATIVAVFSVQALYYNAVLLFAICGAAAIIAARNRHWRRAAVVLGIGLVSALSLIPYRRTIASVSQWNVIFNLPTYDFHLFWFKLSTALSAAGPGLSWVWVGFVGAAIVAGIFIKRGPDGTSARYSREVGFYCVAILLISIPSYYGFLRFLSYPTQPWYYVALMGIVAMCTDGCLANLPLKWHVTHARWMVSLSIALWSLVPVWNAAHVRRTNVDLAATALNRSVEANDTVVVNPWYFGVSLDRYYRGTASWNTIPPIGFHAFHRYDLLKEQMTLFDPIEPLLKTIGEALKSGHRVWIVGNFPLAQPPPQLAPAPYDPVGWSESAYTQVWEMQVGYFIQTHALSAKLVSLSSDQPVNPYEDAQVVVVRGWKDVSGGW